MLEIPPPTDDTYPGWGRNLEGADEQVSACEGDGDAPGQLTEFLGSAPLTLTDAQVAKGAFGAYAVTGIQYATFIPGPAAWHRQRGDRERRQEHRRSSWSSVRAACCSSLHHSGSF